MKKYFQPVYLVIAAVVIILIIIVVLSAGGSPSTGANATSTASTSSAAAASSTVKVSANVYYNRALGFSFANPHPSTWIMNTKTNDGSLVYFGPRTEQVGVGMKLYYWPGASEFPGTVSISSVADLEKAVIAKYPQTPSTSFFLVYSGGFAMVEVKNLTAGFNTTNAYFVLLPSGTLNFSYPGSISGLIERI
ncbi:MAG: hypothetical protein KGH93_02730 [Patescibacteria group bacterium]|nr:hypothetical protein [Patescibacteria group bacterium]MDE1946087.1 hypothetical protein [Patescibacteria group bacterium]